MLTIEQVRAKLKRGKEVRGRLLTSEDGNSWIRVTLSNQSQLDYYLSRIACYGLIEEYGLIHN